MLFALVDGILSIYAGLRLTPSCNKDCEQKLFNHFQK